MNEKSRNIMDEIREIELKMGIGCEEDATHQAENIRFNKIEDVYDNCTNLSLLFDMVMPDDTSLMEKIFRSKKVLSGVQINLLATKFARRALPLFENVYPHDKRPQKAIETVEKWVRSPFRKIAPASIPFGINDVIRDAKGATEDPKHPPKFIRNGDAKASIHAARAALDAAESLAAVDNSLAVSYAIAAANHAAVAIAWNETERACSRDRTESGGIHFDSVAVKMNSHAYQNEELEQCKIFREVMPNPFYRYEWRKGGYAESDKWTKV